MTLPHLIQVLGTLGADHVGLVPVEEISFEPAFRALCEQNACGMYGRSWMCPPEVGEIHALIAQAQQYESSGNGQSGQFYGRADPGDQAEPCAALPECDAR